MSDDPLAPFRRSVTPSPALVVNREREEYEAFEAKDRARSGRLHLRCVNAPSHYPAYSYIIDIICDERDHSGIILMLSTMLITITGRNLRAVAEALAMGTCSFVQEFDAKRFTPPTDPSVPLVERIEVHTGRDMQQSESRKAK